MKKSKAGKVLMIILIATAAITAFGFIVMGLWNAILPQVITGVKAITFWQALGILALSKILFGFGKGGSGWGQKRREWKEKMKDKFNAMTPEEKEQFKAEWKNRCGGMSWRPQPWKEKGTAD